MELLEKFGASIAFAVAVGWFLAYRVWPQFVKQQETLRELVNTQQAANAKLQQDGAAAQQEFVRALDAMGERFQQHSDVMADKMDTIIESVRQRRKGSS